VFNHASIVMLQRFVYLVHYFNYKQKGEKSKNFCCFFTACTCRDRYIW